MKLIKNICFLKFNFTIKSNPFFFFFSCKLITSHHITSHHSGNYFDLIRTHHLQGMRDPQSSQKDAL